MYVARQSEAKFRAEELFNISFPLQISKNVRSLASAMVMKDKKFLLDDEKRTVSFWRT